MSDQVPVTDADREALRMNAYYYGFTPTGEYAVDKILSAVAHAGKAFHSTEEWSDTDCYKLTDFGGSGCPQEWIQFAAQECAQAIARARADADEAGYSRGLREGAASEREAKDAAYAERNKLALLLAVAFKGTIRRATDAEFGWSSVVLIPTRAGQISFHLHDSELSYALSFPIAIDLFEYDGHTTEEKWERVRVASGGNPYEQAIRARGEGGKA